MTDDKIPCRGEWRGVPLHDGQSETRLAAVRRDIDDAHALGDVGEMVEFADDVGRAPEARIYARLKALAYREAETERRAPRSRATELDRERINASARGLDSIRWRSPTHYGSKLDQRPKPGEPDRRVKRETPLE